jgi:peroxiredoxin
MTQTLGARPVAAQTLAERLENTAAQLAEIAPPALFGVFSAEQQRLAAADEPAARIEVGHVLSRTTLRDATGKLVDVPGDVPAVIVFYRGVWCPYCNVALASYQRELLPELTARGVKLIAISPQGSDGSLDIVEKNDLSFPVLTDAGGEYARHLGITFDLTDDVKAAQLAFGNDFTNINAGGEWSLPKPTVLVVDSNRVVRFVDVQPDYTKRTDPAAILEAVRARR